jgi:CubicO group peptidase (beta-lactamase class C family)
MLQRHEMSLPCLFILIALILVGCGNSTIATHTALNAATFSDVTKILQAEIDKKSINGAGLIIIKQHQAIYTQSFGVQKNENVLPLAGATTLMSATAIMTLVDEGKVQLDTPITQYLPQWPTDKAAITLRQLLSHTSGLPSEVDCMNKKINTLAQCEQEIAKLPLQAAPGSSFIYSSADYQVAGYIAEIVSGQPWNDFFSQRIGNPCKMQHSHYGGPNPRIANGAVSDLHDYSILLDLHLSGGLCGTTRVLSAQSVTEMQRDAISQKPIRFSPYTDGRHFGLGWWIDPVQGGATTEFSVSGSSGAIPWIDTKHNYGAFLLLRSQLPNGIALWNTIKPLINGHMG